MRSMSGGGSSPPGTPLQDPHPNPPLFKGREPRSTGHANPNAIAQPQAMRVWHEDCVDADYRFLAAEANWRGVMP
jgi:hypothetical protein